MKKYIILVFLILCSNVEAKELNVSFHPQNTLVWCWAATIAMIGEYVTGQPAEDCEVLSAYDRMLMGPGNCCEFPQSCLRTGHSQEIKSILSNIYGISGYHHVRPLSFDEIKSEIDDDQPFIAALRGGFSGHVVVVVGYKDPNKVILLDPMSGRHKVQYSQLLRNFQLGNWTETFTVNNQELHSSRRSRRNTRHEPCNHLKHPDGHRIQCSHRAHPRGHIMPCQHMCNYFGMPVPCHPNGDIFPCQHPAHPFDMEPCNHIAHPGGHTR